MGTPASFKSFATLAARAATPAERLGGAYEPEPPDPAPGADRVPARLAFWLRKAAGGDAGYLARWLEWEGLDAAAVRRALGPVRLKDSEPLPPWAVLWGELTAGPWGAPLETVPGPAPVPFQELLAPLARAARCRHEAGTPGPDRLTQAAWADLERGLLERLLKAAGPTLQAEFSRFREPWVSTLDLAMAGAAGAPPPGTGIYRAFLREQCREGGSPGAFRAYPALARVLAQLAGHWISAWTEALARLEAHAGQLRDRFFDGADPGPVAAIRTGAGDSHNQGRATAILRFQDGSRLVYKPVPAGVDRAWYRLLDWIAARGGPLLPRSPRHLDGPGHGWTEFVEAAPCPDPEALRRYFLRCGALLCLVQLLGGGDCHHENLIAAGEHPILLDLETVMTPELWLPPDPERLPATRPELPALALQTGLLPRWIEAEGHVVDISGFASVASRSYQDPCWSHPGTDLMDLGASDSPAPGLEAFLASAVDSKHTRRAYLGDLRSLFAFLEERAPGTSLAELSVPLLRSWLAAQAGAGVARTTLARRTSAIKTFTAWATRIGLIDGDPATRLQMPKARRTLPSVLRQDQALDAMAAATSGAQQGDPLALRDRLIVELLYATGIRVSELCGLDVDDVDTTGWSRVLSPVEPRYGAPKLKTPPSAATSQ